MCSSFTRIFYFIYLRKSSKKKEKSKDSDAISYDYSKKMTELVQETRDGVISMEKYQIKIMQLQVDMQMSGINKKFRPIIREIITSNKYPEITFYRFVKLSNFSESIYLPSFQNYLH